LTSASDVTFSPVSSDDATDIATLGTWVGGLYFGVETMDTAKVYGDNLYAQFYEGSGSYYPEVSCCADTVRVYNKYDDADNYSEIDLHSLITVEAFGDSGYTAQASHTFDFAEIDGQTFLFSVVYYYHYNSGDSSTTNECYAVVAIDLATNELVSTLDGDRYWDMANFIKGDDDDDSPYLINYMTHASGLVSFTHEGTDLLGMTWKDTNEIVVWTNPWSTTAEDGGGAIVQRFGTPKSKETGVNSFSFGFDYGDFTFKGMHNAWYSTDEGQLTVFINGITTDGDKESYIFNFDVNIVREEDVDLTGDIDTDEEVFDTDYTYIELSFQTSSTGGGRGLGNGVYITSTGTVQEGMAVVDGTDEYFYEADINPDSILNYDPFVYVQA